MHRAAMSSRDARVRCKYPAPPETEKLLIAESADGIGLLQLRTAWRDRLFFFFFFSARKANGGLDDNAMLATAEKNIDSSEQR